MDDFSIDHTDVKVNNIDSLFGHYGEIVNHCQKRSAAFTLPIIDFTTTAWGCVLEDPNFGTSKAVVSLNLVYTDSPMLLGLYKDLGMPGDPTWPLTYVSLSKPLRFYIMRHGYKRIVPGFVRFFQRLLESGSRY